MVVKTATYIPLEDFEEKQILKNCTRFQQSSDFEVKKIGPLVEKFSSGFLQQDIALSEEYFKEKWFFFRKSFVFILSFFEFERFRCLFANFISQVYQNTDLSVEKKEIVENYMKKCFFNQFWTLSRRKLWLLAKR